MERPISSLGTGTRHCEIGGKASRIWDCCSHPEFSAEAAMKDLVLVVADKNMHFALRGALSRPEAMGIRPITVEFLSTQDATEAFGKMVQIY